MSQTIWRDGRSGSHLETLLARRLHSSKFAGVICHQAWGRLTLGLLTLAPGSIVTTSGVACHQLKISGMDRVKAIRMPRSSWHGL